MKKFIRFFVFAFAFTLATISLVSCGETNEKVAAEAIKLLLVEQEPVVEKDFTVGGLVSYKGTSYQVTWTSNNECLAVGERVSNKDENGVEIAAHYVVKATRPETGSVDVKLTATVNAGEGDVATKDFTYTLYAVDVFDIAASYTFSKANKVAKESFDLDSEWTYAGKKATITWTVDNEAVTIADGKATFNVKEEVNVVFTAEFTYGDTSAKFPYTVTLAPSENGPTVITTIADGQSYYIGVNQETLGKYLYFAGKSANKEYYMETTENAAASTKVTVHAITGGYALSFVDAAGATKYLDIVANGTYVNLYIVDTQPTTPFVWNEDYNTFTKDINGTVYYFGTYNNFNTLSASKFDFIDTSYPCHFYQLPYGPIAEFTSGTSYKLASYQEALGQTLYFAGKTANKDYYMATTENVAEATDVIATAVEGGYVLSFVDAEGATKYLDIVDGSYVNLYIVDTKPATPFVWNAEYSTFTKDINGTVYYFGTYKTYNTLSASKFDFIATSYPCHFYAEGGSLPEPTPEETPEKTPEGEVSELPTTLAAGTYTITLTAKVEETTNFVEGNNATTVGLDATLFNVVAAGNDYAGYKGGTTLPGLAKDGTIRLYAGSNSSANGNSVTISALEVEGFTITFKSVELTADTSKKDGTYSVNGIACTAPVTSDHTVENFELTGNTVTIQNTSNAGKQIRFKTIVITVVVTAK